MVSYSKMLYSKIQFVLIEESMSICEASAMLITGK